MSMLGAMRRVLSPDDLFLKEAGEMAIVMLQHVGQPDHVCRYKAPGS